MYYSSASILYHAADNVLGKSRKSLYTLGSQEARLIYTLGFRPSERFGVAQQKFKVILILQPHNVC